MILYHLIYVNLCRSIYVNQFKNPMLSFISQTHPT